MTEPWVDYKMERVTFGVTSSPYLAIKTLMQTAADFGSDYPVAKKHIEESFYVDNFFAGADTPLEASKLRIEISEILLQAGFRIKKWRSSSSAVLDSIPSDLVESIPDCKMLDSHSVCYPKALGLVWDSEKDEMATSVQMTSSYSSTKRGVVSDIARTFDILGWLSPVILEMKILYRTLWERKLDWDQEVPPDLKQQHEKWRTSLPLLAQVRLPRHYFGGRKPKEISLHGFSDASARAFSAVVYLRAVYETGPPTSVLVLSKTREAPLKSRTIPELELCGAHLLAKIMDTTSLTLGIEKDKISAYCDSTIVLSWLDGNPKCYRLYVANRIHKTVSLMPPSVWHYVPTALNPADCASRGISAEELIHHSLWWHEPPWLQEEVLVVPARPTRTKVEQLLDDEHQSKKKEVKIVAAIIPAMDSRIEECSNSFNKVLRVTCWMNRFIASCQKKSVSSSLELSVDEMNKAENLLKKRSQMRTFGLELQFFNSNPPQPLPNKSKLLSLLPEVNDQGLLCVGGRLRNALVEEQQKHPVIISVRDVFARLLFSQIHKDLMHGGLTAIISQAGNRFYVTGARKLARTICQTCVICRKAAAKIGPQLIGQLPSARLNPDYVFFHTGLDYAGPFYLKEGYVRRPVKIKAWMAIFVCFQVKAVHLEIVKDATTKSLIAALCRFCSRRALPLVLYSDNGSNMIGAKNELSELYAVLQSKETQNCIQSYLLNQRVRWELTPVKAPHFGGLWEAAVKAAKYHIKRLTGGKMYTYDELETIFCQAEACLNSRPLGVMASHPLDGMVPLTPGHFLVGRALKSYPVEMMNFNPTPLQRWAQCHKISQKFWKRWSTEYMVQLQKAVKWHRKTRNLQVGDVVLLTDGNTLACQWTNAKVVAIYPGKDGVVRAVDVRVEHKIIPKKWTTKENFLSQLKTRTAMYRRPVSKLALILSADDLPESCRLSTDEMEQELTQKQSFSPPPPPPVCWVLY